VADAVRVITSPLAVAAGLRADDLSVAVAADALARRAWAVGRPASVVLQALAGDLGGRLAFDTDLVRAGHDRSTLTAAELGEIARASDAARRAAAADQLASLRVAPELDEGSVTAASRRAASVAFVRLYDEGLIAVAPAVVPYCPSCGTVIEGPDAVAGDVDADILRVRMRGDVEVDVTISAPELIEGAVAIAVPIGHSAAGGHVRLPLVAREVPVLAETGCTAPRLMVPAHDASAFDLAQLHGLVPVAVLGADGVVCIDGALSGLPRYAARQAARALLEAEDAVVDIEAGVEHVERCRPCGSVAIALLGTHWMLDVRGLEVAAADAIRNGSVGFVPVDVRDTVLALAGGDRWCLDRSVAGAVPLPVAECADCQRVSVEVEPPSMCGKCFGDVRHSGLTLDARFVAALAPLVAAEWPARVLRSEVDAASSTVAVVSRDAVASWALPALALGLHLAGYLPFGALAMQPSDPAADTTFVLEDLEGADPRAARLALLAGTEIATAARVVEGLDNPTAGDRDEHDVVNAVDDAVVALDEGGPGRAARLLLAALTGGVPASAAERVRALAVPFLGA
jgi:valyl-tRNA synthetase